MFKATIGKLAIAGLLLLTGLGGTVATASAQGTLPGQGAARAAVAVKAGHFLQNELALIAGTIGIPTTELKTALKDGQTVAQVAQAHNVSAQKVIDAVVNDITARAQARPGWAKLTDAQRTTFTTNTRTRVTNVVNNGAKAGVRHPIARARVAKAEFDVAAKTIGISPADLRTAVKGGQTVAQVAQAHNVQPQTVIDAVVNDLTAKAQARPGWAKLTDAQKTTFTTNTRTRITAWVNGTGRK
jgi:DNA polymerase IIIc chi subunit